ncbi:MAG: tetratricopeptide repeat protein [Rhodospirillales bacterium]|jgi:tetratricopeptide (TPR) repeat protein|nr:tetratricopeptide repeat protein [Rhodospirillales bacterium]
MSKSFDTKEHLSNVRIALADKQFKKAEKLLKRLLKSGDSAEAFFLYGCVHVQQENPEAAIKMLEKAKACSLNNSNILNILGVAYYLNNAFTESIENLRMSVKLNPANSEACGNLGLALHHDGWHAEAANFLKQAIDAKKASMKVLMAWLSELKITGKIDELEEALKPLIKAMPENADLLCLQVNVCAMRGHVSRMEILRQRVLEIDPENHRAYYQRAMYLSAQGEMDGVKKDVDKVLSIDPYDAHAIFAKVHLITKHNKSPETIASDQNMVEAALSREGIPFDDWAMLKYSLGLLEEMKPNYQEAFHHVDEANKEIWKRQYVDEGVYFSIVSDLSKFFSKKFFVKKKKTINRKPAKGDDLGKGLIFIFGMPRSGTTLVENVLSRGGKVTAGGERGDIDTLFTSLVNSGVKVESGLANIGAMSLVDIRETASEHLANIQRMTGNTIYFCDKNLRNFLNLGLLVLLFPKAKFINCKRDPADTCLSNYFTHYGWNSIRYSYDLKTLGLYYRLYELIMKHWRKNLPAPILDIVYEDMIESPEESARALVGFCELEWNDNYLAHEKAEGKFATASIAQVRQPLYRTSINKWKSYEKYLTPLLEQLDRGISLD